MAGSVRSCCVPKCGKSRGDNVVLHSFPNPVQEKELFNIWKNAVGESVSSLTNEFIVKNRKICHDHFEEKYLTWSRRLADGAVPTLHMPESKPKVCETPTPATSAPAPEPKPLQSSPPEELDPLALDVKSEHEDSETETLCEEEAVYETNKEHVTAVPLDDKFKDTIKTDANPVPPILKGILTTSDAVNTVPQTQNITEPQASLTGCKVKPKIVLRRGDLKEIKILNRPLIKLTKTSCPLSLLQKLKSDNQKQVVHPTAQLPQSDSTASPMNLPPRDIAQTPLLTELKLCEKENWKLRKELDKLQTQNKLLKTRLTYLKRALNDRKAMFDKVTANMSAPAKALFEMQFQSKKKISGRRYSLPGRIIALSIYKASPACYAMLSKYFVLPSVKILKRFVASVTKQAATAETNTVKETDTNALENVGDQDMTPNDKNQTDSVDSLHLNDNDIKNTFQPEIDKASEAVYNIVYEKQVINKEPQSSQATGGMHQITDDTSEVQTVELCEGEALQLADGRIFQLIDGQIVEVIGELEQDELNVPSDNTGSSDELNPTVKDLQSTQECEQGTFIVKPLRRYCRARDELVLQNETPLLQDNVSSTQQTTIDHYQQSHRDTSPLSMTSKPNSFDGRPANVNELCISNPLRSQVGEQATEIKHPHRTQLQHTKHKQATKETSSFPDMSRMVTLPVTNLKRVATDKEPLTSPTSAAQLYRVQQCYRKRLKTKKTTSRGPDMPDLTFS